MNEMKYSFSIELLEKFVLKNRDQWYVVNPYTSYYESNIYKKYIEIHYIDKDKFQAIEEDMEFFLKSINSGIVPQSIIDEIIEFSISNL
jgi:hypothetical protein